MEPYERFEAWKQAYAFSLEAYRVTCGWPTEERYGLISQLRRAAFSAVVNIVEGSSRKGRGEFRRFLDISHASMAECGFILRMAHDLRYLDDGAYAKLAAQRSSAGRLIFLLLRSMGT
jgi:four helix bundle protein